MSSKIVFENWKFSLSNFPPFPPPPPMYGHMDICTHYCACGREPPANCPSEISSQIRDSENFRMDEVEDIEYKKKKKWDLV